MKYSIPVYRLDKLIKRIESYNKKAVKYKVQSISYTISDAYDVNLYPDNAKDIFGEPVTRVVSFKDIDINLDILTPIKGYQFLASVEHSPNGNILISRMPGIEIPKKYRISADHCDHCGIARYRKTTYIVYNEKSKKYVQVGSTCIKDYLGINVGLVAARFGIVNLFNDAISREYTGEFRGIETFNLKSFLAVTCRVIELDGFVSGKVAWEQGKQSTGNTVLDVLCTRKPDEWTLTRRQVTEDNKALVQTVQDWVLQQKPDNDYMTNLITIFKNGYVSYKTANIAASAIFCYKKAHNELNKKKWDLKKSQYIGKVGDVIKEKVEFLGDYTTESRFGVMFINRFITMDGNLITWFTSKRDTFDVGNVYDMVAKVKQYNEWKEMKTTIVKNAKVK